MNQQQAVYILASKRNGTLYIGVTSNLAKRTWQHKNDRAESFTKEYGVHTLVYYEPHPTMLDAIRREKRLKKWNRAWKLELIEKVNPEWKDLSSTIVGIGTGQYFVERMQVRRRSRESGNPVLFRLAKTAVLWRAVWIPAFAGTTNIGPGYFVKLCF